jgi:hypothetical protein
VPFDVPQSHCVETRFTHVPTEEQRTLLADLGVQLKYKKFSPYEDAVICKNWERFSKVIKFHICLNLFLIFLKCLALKSPIALQDYEFEGMEPFLLFGHKHLCCLKYSERKHFVQYLGHGLPHRTLYSIYARFLTLYRSSVKGK